MPIFVGHAGLKGDFHRYAKQFDFVELSAEAGRLPKRAKLRHWREQAPDRFRFALSLPSAVCALADGAEVRRHLERALGDADVLAARWVVIRTPASVRPSLQNERKLAALVQACHGDRLLAWEPGGLWETDAASRIAGDLGVHLVRDPRREEIPDPAAPHYLRIRALGVSARLTTGAAEHVADVVSELEDCHLAVEGGAAGRVRRALRDVLGEPASSLDDEEDEEDDLDEDVDE